MGSYIHLSSRASLAVFGLGKPDLHHSSSRSSLLQQWPAIMILSFGKIPVKSNLHLAELPSTLDSLHLCKLYRGKSLAGYITQSLPSSYHYCRSHSSRHT